MAVNLLNKQAQKAIETRQLLLKSAETIFVRDGYEGAELGEIASLAGRTKGAIYSHFSSKEDLFLALFEQRTQRWSSRFSDMVAASNGKEQNLEVFRHFLLSISKDSAWLLLLLEFKLYAARNPKSKKRLQKAYKAMYPADEKVYNDLFGKPQTAAPSLSRSSAIMVLLPLLSALAAEKQFAPELLDNNEVRKVAFILFQALMG